MLTKNKSEIHLRLSAKQPVCHPSLIWSPQQYLVKSAIYEIPCYAIFFILLTNHLLGLNILHTLFSNILISVLPLMWEVKVMLLQGKKKNYISR
jgi:hypothetical protein